MILGLIVLFILLAIFGNNNVGGGGLHRTKSYMRRFKMKF
jgi:hypothetical protein